MEFTTESIGTHTSPSESPNSRIHFPANDPSPSRARYRPPETPPKAQSAPYKPSHSRGNSPLNPRTTSPQTTSRRRVRSVDTPDFPDSTRLHRTAALSLINSSRGTGYATRRHTDLQLQADHFDLGIPSDEYDLSHEDPRILQDVQRALKLKARREARARSSESSSQPTDPSSNTSPSQATYLTIPSSPSPRKVSVASEVDFSPSVGASSIHPIPASLDNGITLDWSGYAFDEPSEKRWKISTIKRKTKEKLPQVSTVLDQQAKAHSDKLSRIKASASQQTLRKAEITREQLGRRYDLIYSSSSGSATPNLVTISRWYRAQDSMVRGSLEKAQPFTWIRHLDKRSASTPDRLHWHLSALIIEEYGRAQLVDDSSGSAPMNTIPEDFVLSSIPPPLSAIGDVKYIAASSHTSSDYSLSLPLARKPSYEDRPSFEPLVEPTRRSVGGSSLQDSDSGQIVAASGQTAQAVATSPKSTRSKRDLSSRVIQKLKDESADVSSPSDLTSDSEPSGNQHWASSPVVRVTPDKPESFPAPDSSSEGYTSRAGITLEITLPTPGITPDSDLALQKDEPGLIHVNRRRRVRTSLPSIDHVSKAIENKRQQEADDEKAYELKSRLLDETTAHNHRIRQLLNRISSSVREYDMAQCNAMASLALSHKGLPRELLDAFGHDPAAVTGATRRFRGWRATDDIHNRLARQRGVFQAFLSSSHGDVAQPKSVLDDPIATLLQSVEKLEAYNIQIAQRAMEVDETLLAVQDMHTNVKKHYRTALSETSIVYPELSTIVALEESYKDQYQQFWEIGMDTLTFLLDTVTPLWRTYGKSIGEDVRDFLVVPLYRNEFTGEPKRYPIPKFPKRSLRHSFGLVIFFFASIAINILQARAAISSATHYTLPMIPYESIRWTALPFFWIGIFIQWWAVIMESAIVLMQVGVVLWWAGWSIKLFT